ncbi:alpha-tocopherol transfer protein-like [Zerene cesonia]|uniref:alpha-tocopherol transfer protein-like n=1 Tax=Zerene cesonia TaxID=33412 RepID=UPI0018E59440|nr:alpha-tocopherol transfer protein-like [Zerene cesonia]
MEVKEFPVEEEYKKGTGVTPDDVAKIRKWLQTQPHLPEKYITDLDIIHAYYSCNNSIEVAKQLMDLNYSLRTHFTSYFKDRLFDSKTEGILKKQLFVFLPGKSKAGNTILYTHGLNTDPSTFDVADNMKAFFMSIDFWQYECGTAPGLELVVNFVGYNMSHAPKIDLKNVQQFLYYVQKAIPIKLKKIHLLNSPPFIERLMNMMKPFIANELIHVVLPHSEGFKTLQEYIPVEAFPKDIGGNSKTLNEFLDEVINKLRANKSFFEHENKKRVVESLRPGKPKTYTDIFGGVGGSFKKLDID